MKGRKVPVCLMLAVVLLLPFFADGLPGGSLSSQLAPTPDAERGDGLHGAATPVVELMAPANEIQRLNNVYTRCFVLVLALFLQRAPWKEPRFVGVRHENNKRFAVEGKTSHPQQAPPVSFQPVM